VPPDFPSAPLESPSPLAGEGWGGGCQRPDISQVAHPHPSPPPSRGRRKKERRRGKRETGAGGKWNGEGKKGGSVVSLALFSLAGKVVIVTGSGRGLGRAIAKGMAAAGAAVVTCSRTLAEAESAAQEIAKAHGQAIAVAADVARAADCERLVAAAVERFGRLGVMHCHATIDVPQ